MVQEMNLTHGPSNDSHFEPMAMATNPTSYSSTALAQDFALV